MAQAADGAGGAEEGGRRCGVRSEQDRDIFVSDYGIENVFVIPTGVDLGYFGAEPDSADPSPSEVDNRIVSTGSMDWMPNIDSIQYMM